jgi:hypothetical protein
MDDKKQVTIRLFFNRSNGTFYIQLSDTLIPIRDKLVTAIQEKQQLNIIHVADVKEMQLKCLEDEKQKE